jgi:hypothetical protein
MAEIVLASCIGAFVGIGVIGFLYERYEWNGGTCRATNEPWEQFDTDSQGGRGYKSGEKHVVWVSWPIDQQRCDERR